MSRVTIVFGSDDKIFSGMKCYFGKAVNRKLWQSILVTEYLNSSKARG